MLVGYNTNIPYKGDLYHVQTEDNGIKNPVLITLLYLKGTILASKKISYAHLAGSPDYKGKVRELMKEQHKSMIKGLIRGVHTGGDKREIKQDAAVPAPEAATVAGTAVMEPEAKVQISGSLDDVLLDFIIRETGREEGGK